MTPGAKAGAPEPAVRVTDLPSKIFVIATVVIFVAILLNGLLLGSGGILTGRPTPEPTAVPTASESAAPSASGASAAPSVSAATSATPSVAPTSTPAASVSAAPSGSVAP